MLDSSLYRLSLVISEGSCLIYDIYLHIVVSRWYSCRFKVTQQLEQTTVYLSMATEFTPPPLFPRFGGVHVAQSLILCVVFCRPVFCLSSCPFCVCNFIVCPFSDWPFGIFKIVLAETNTESPCSEIFIKGATRM